jgi:hypothetical protein
MLNGVRGGKETGRQGVVGTKGNERMVVDRSVGERVVGKGRNGRENAEVGDGTRRSEVCGRENAQIGDS